MKILLVEDDERQLVYAREILKEHTLDIAADADEATAIIERATKPEIVMTDLYIPWDSESNLDRPKKASFKAGLTIFQLALKKLVIGEIKGLALVSNFEHHVHGLEPEAEQPLRSFYEDQAFLSATLHLIDIVGKELKIYNNGKWFTSKKKHSLTVCVFFDKDLTFFKHFLSPEGKVVSGEEKEQHLVAGTELISEIDQYTLVREGDLNLKPFHRIVEVLTSSINQ